LISAEARKAKVGVILNQGSVRLTWREHVET